VVQDTCSQQVL